MQSITTNQKLGHYGSNQYAGQIGATTGGGQSNKPRYIQLAAKISWQRMTTALGALQARSERQLRCAMHSPHRACKSLVRRTMNTRRFPRNLAWLFTIVLLFGCGDSVASAQPAFPLHTAGQYMVDSNGYRVRLNAFNWYGTESTDYVVAGLQTASLQSIVDEIKSLGFNRSEEHT